MTYAIVNRTFISCLLALLGCSYSVSAYCQSEDSEISIAERLCKTKGSASDIKVNVDGSGETSKVVASVIGVRGKINGTAEFSKAEWDGIRFSDKPDAYNRCLEIVLGKVHVDKATGSSEASATNYGAGGGAIGNNSGIVNIGGKN